MANECSLAVFSVYYRYFYFVCTTKAITDNNLASCCDGIKAIRICAVKMFQCILTASRIKGVAVCEEWKSTLLLAKVSNYFCIVRTQERHVSKLSKVHLDCYEFAIHINVFDSGCDTKFFQLIKLACADRASKICEINC